MRGMSQHGITQIGFGNHATTVDVNDLYPMEISKPIPEEKDIDEYATYTPSGKNKVTKMSMRNRRRSSSTSMHETSPKDVTMSGRKRRGSDVPLQSIGNYLNKRHCNNNHAALPANENSNHPMMMMVDDGNSRQMAVHDETSKNNHNNLNYMSEQLTVYQSKNDELNVENAELKKKVSELQRDLSKQHEMAEKLEIESERNDRACKSVQELLNEIAISERQERESKLLEDNKLLGRVVQHQSNNFGQVSDIWEDGHLFEDLKRRRKELEREKQELETQKKEIRKLKNKRQKAAENNDSNLNCNNSSNGGMLLHDESQTFLIPKSKAVKQFDELCLDSEIISVRLALIKKQLNELDVEYQQLEYRKKIHIKFIRLMRDEKKSRFSIVRNQHECYVLNERYVLTNLLGRGGFSEVHRGYDLVEHKYIAAKIHQLNSHWSDERKRNYTKHATREYDIHKSLNHKNIVCLYDVFGIDVNSFCTVLEYCNGMDLDMYLKINKVLQEREARSLIVQVFIGLKYLHNQTSPGPIIHYDLKPGNLLYKNGLIKLTDFGLAKIMNNDMDSENAEIELTSQGAGTYWYLPPECFQQQQSVMISPKVDIWSGGVIFYQMLFGKRPFGDNMSQDTILNNKTILNARHVSFPSQPKSVSAEAKEFIAQCCAYDAKLRLSASQIVDNHPYFAFLRK